MRKLLTILVAIVMFTGTSSAQDGDFDDLYLDGGAGSNPFIRFEHSNSNLHYLAGFGTNVATFVTNGYKFRIYETADSNALTLDDAGVNVKRKINIAGLTNSESRIDISHTTDQTFSIRSLNVNQGLYGGGIGFGTDSNRYPFYVFDGAKDRTLAVHENGVGIGIYGPSDALHVHADGFNFPKAKVVVENNIAGDPVPRNMFELINNGAARFSFTDTSINSAWVFSTIPNGAFSISKDGTGGSEFIVYPSGRVIMGPGGAQNLDLKPNGNLHIAGTLVQASDKNLKKGFADVDHGDVLDRVAHLPIQTWQFKSDETESRHMGPTAQDFQAAFSLGHDDRTIAPVDGVGVALSAIKALKQESDDQATRIAALESVVQTQQKQLSEQKQLIAALIERLDDENQINSNVNAVTAAE